VERNPFTGNEWLPNLRFDWLRDNDTLVWAALSRAVRAPSRIDREVFVPGAPPYLLTGANAFESEIANVAELGYRTQASAEVSFSATALLPPLSQPAQRGAGRRQARVSQRHRGPHLRNRGVGHVPAELDAARDRRRRGAGHLPAREARAIDLGGLAILGNSPERMAQVRASWSPRADVDFDLFTRYVGKLQSVVPAYSATDLRLAWRPNRPLELSVSVRNAFDREHIEWQNRGLVERSFFLHLRWQAEDGLPPARYCSLRCSRRGCAAQPATEPAVKAAFLYKFAAYVEWPESALAGAEAPFVIAVAGPMRSRPSWRSWCPAARSIRAASRSGD
jgi:iron complex outermembrane receptor protein